MKILTGRIQALGSLPFRHLVTGTGKLKTMGTPHTLHPKTRLREGHHMSALLPRSSTRCKTVPLRPHHHRAWVRTQMWRWTFSDWCGLGVYLTYYMIVSVTDTAGWGTDKRQQGRTHTRPWGPAEARSGFWLLYLVFMLMIASIFNFIFIYLCCVRVCVWVHVCICVHAHTHTHVMDNLQ